MHLLVMERDMGILMVVDMESIVRFQDILSMDVVAQILWNLLWEQTQVFRRIRLKYR